MKACKIVPKSDVVLDYSLTGVGWSQCHIAIGASAVTITASYLGDALGDLASATVNLLTGHTSARCSFDEEPGEYRWVFEVMSGTLRVQVLSFSDLWSHAPDDQGEEIFCGSCAVTEFAAAVLKAMQNVLSKHGLEGYKSKWVEHDFPLDAFKQIEKELSVLGVVA